MERALPVLVLGGSSEASALAALLAGDARFAPVLSLAGRTARPRPQPVPVRSGGFGGVAGLVAALRGFAVLVDATHPFAARMSANAVAAAAEAGVGLLRVERPAWQRVGGDRWTDAATMTEAVRLLGRVPRRVLLTVGRTEVAAFAAAPQHRYVVRSIDPPEGLPGAEAIAAAGPFTLDGERALLASRGIEVLVAKNAGGAATAPKLQAAREAGVGVVMVARPVLPAAETVADAAGAFAWLVRRHAAWRGA